MSNFFLTNEKGEKFPLNVIKNGSRHTLSNVLATSVLASFGLLGAMAIIAETTDNEELLTKIWDGVNTITIMVIGGFLALVKEILHPRREVSFEDMIKLAHVMGNKRSQ